MESKKINKNMENNKIRPLALAIIKKGNKILVQPGYDSKEDQKFYRLPGGGIEFSEKGAEALKREFVEEFNSGLNNIKFLGFLENIFTFAGEKGHEIIMIHEADLEKESLYKEKLIKILDHDTSHAIWEDVEVLKKSHLYPDGVIKFI